MYATPAQVAELKATAGSTTRRIYDYPGGYAAKDAGDARASRRLAEMESAALRMCGTGTVRAFVAGSRFTLAGHPQGVLNQTWLLRSVRLCAELGRFDNEFVAILGSKPYRPKRRTPRPRHGFGAYFAPGPALWEDPRLLRDDAAAARLAAALGSGKAIVMRANGAVVCGDSLVEAVALLPQRVRCALAGRHHPHLARVVVALEQTHRSGEQSLRAQESSKKLVHAGQIGARAFETDRAQ